MEYAESPASEDELDAMAGFAAHMVQPSAYAIPPQTQKITPPEELQTVEKRGFPASLPRAESVGPNSAPLVEPEAEEQAISQQFLGTMSKLH